MKLGHELEDKYWWAEFEQAQDDENCPVMVWLKLAFDELHEGRAPPPPDPAELETAWWHRELVSADRPANEIFTFKEKHTADGDIIVVMYNSQVIVPPKLRAAIVWHVHCRL